MLSRTQPSRSARAAPSRTGPLLPRLACQRPLTTTRRFRDERAPEAATLLPVRFEVVQHHLEFGEVLGVCGNSRELGGWTPQAALRLKVRA